MFAKKKLEKNELVVEICNTYILKSDSQTSFPCASTARLYFLYTAMHLIYKTNFQMLLAICWKQGYFSYVN